MELTEKPHHHMEGSSAESEAKIWVIAGIPLKCPLKPLLLTNQTETKSETEKKDDQEEVEECFRTPTAEEARIPSILTCPQAPKKKRKPSSSFKCHYNGVSVTTTVKEFFTPPDLETVFKCRIEKV